MSSKAMQIANMIDMLPKSEQELAVELLKRLILAWDPDFTKLTALEKAEVDEAESGEYIDENDIDWNNLIKYAD
jgi:hypothetical protein